MPTEALAAEAEPDQGVADLDLVFGVSRELPDRAARGPLPHRGSRGRADHVARAVRLVSPGGLVADLERLPRAHGQGQGAARHPQGHLVPRAHVETADARPARRVEPLVERAVRQPLLQDRAAAEEMAPREAGHAVAPLEFLVRRLVRRALAVGLLAAKVVAAVERDERDPVRGRRVDVHLVRQVPETVRHALAGRPGEDVHVGAPSGEHPDAARDRSFDGRAAGDHAQHRLALQPLAVALPELDVEHRREAAAVARRG